MNALRRINTPLQCPLSECGTGAGAWTLVRSNIRKPRAIGGCSGLKSALRSASLGHSRGFSLIEILITMGLLSLIVLGLLAMFNQTQRAFTSSMTQTDVLENGRATMDLFARDLSQMTSSQFPNVLYNGVAYRPTNFFVEPSPGFSVARPLLQEMPNTFERRTNFVQRFFFLTKLNQDWLGTGYQVIPDDTNGVVGTLYRFSVTNDYRYGPYVTASGAFQQAAAIALANALSILPVTNTLVNLNYAGVRSTDLVLANRVADGIVHLRVRVFAANGCLIVTNATPGVLYGTNGVFAILPRPLTGPFYTNVLDTNLYGTVLDPEQSAAYFMGPAIPAYVEVELGILEPAVLKKYHSIPISAVQLQYLSNHVAQVHIFRQRVPVANVDLTAYP